MADYYLGQIIQGGWNFAPQGTLLCAGQLLSIQQNAALFALLGVQFGGNGVQTFGIPDLRGRTMLGAGTSTTHTTYIIGQSAGVETVTLTPNNIPPHNHAATFADHGSSFSAASA